jgi:hypothetical protein
MARQFFGGLRSCTFNNTGGLCTFSLPRQDVSLVQLEIYILRGNRLVIISSHTHVTINRLIVRGVRRRQWGKRWKLLRQPIESVIIDLL